MIHIERLSEPEILKNKKAEWAKKFINSDKSRPDSAKYAHKEIKEALEAMSNNKCFYCERKLHGIKSEVDHYIEVADRKDLAFDWANLYLACDLCNNKLLNRQLSVLEIINPCSENDEEISLHLTFHHEQIIPKNDSQKGLKTIKKYKLDSEKHNYLRLKKQQEFMLLLNDIKDIMISEGRKKINDKEVEVLKVYSNKESSYSMMFSVILKSIV